MSGPVKVMAQVWGTAALLLLASGFLLRAGADAWVWLVTFGLIVMLMTPVEEGR